MTVVVSAGGAGASSTCTFLELLTEFYARGFDYLNQDDAGRTRAKAWINQAYEDVCDVEPWPFLEVQGTAVAPASVTNVRDVIYVIDTTNNVHLQQMDVRDIIDIDADSNPLTAGKPWGYYWDGLTALKVYPAEAVELSIRYIAVPTELSIDTDTPLAPRRFCPLILEGALVKAYMDSDNFEGAQAIQAVYDRRLQRMTDSMFSRSLDGGFVTRTSEHDG